MEKDGQKDRESISGFKRIINNYIKMQRIKCDKDFKDYKDEDDKRE